MATHSRVLPGESHGLKSLTCCSPWGCKESDTTEQLNNIKRTRNAGQQKLLLYNNLLHMISKIYF